MAGVDVPDLTNSGFLIKKEGLYPTFFLEVVLNILLEESLSKADVVPEVTAGGPVEGFGPAVAASRSETSRPVWVDRVAWPAPGARATAVPQRFER